MVGLDIDKRAERLYDEIAPWCEINGEPWSVGTQHMMIRLAREAVEAREKQFTELRADLPDVHGRGASRGGAAASRRDSAAA